MILILLGILILGIGIYRFAEMSLSAKNWTMVVLFVIAFIVILFYAGALAVK